jgi:hypothetical protein
MITAQDLLKKGFVPKHGGFEDPKDTESEWSSGTIIWLHENTVEIRYHHSQMGGLGNCMSFGIDTLEELDYILERMYKAWKK